MKRKGTPPAGTPTRKRRFLRASLPTSLLVHALALDSALVWVANREATPPPRRIGVLDVRTHDEEAALPPKPEDVASPPRVAPCPPQRPPLHVGWASDPRRGYPRSALRSGLGALVRLTIDAPSGDFPAAHGRLRILREDLPCRIP